MDWEERNFQKVDGGHAFYPYGTLSRGYIVDDAKKAELIAFIKRLNRSWLPVILIAAAAGWWIAGADGFWMGVLLVALPPTAYYHLRVRRTLADLPRTDKRRTFSEQFRSTADAMPSFAIYVILVGFFFITAGDVFFIYESLRDRDVRGLLLPAVALPMFALALLLSVRLLQLRYSRWNLSDHSASRRFP
jgi:hypothetical protein